MKLLRGFATLTVFGLAALSFTACTPAQTTDASSDKSADSLVVYSPQGDGPRGDYIKSHAKEELGLDITFVSGGGAELTSRLLSEKNNSQADVVLGFGDAQINQIQEAGILMPYKPEWATLIPDAFTPAGDYTLFSQTPIVISYNSDVMSAAEAPKTWEDLAKPKYKHKFSFPGVTGQTGQAAIAGILWREAEHATGEVKDQGWETLKSVLTNAKPAAAGEKFDWKNVASGEVPIVVSWVGGIQTAAADNQLPMEIVRPKEGTPFVTTAIGLVKGTGKEQAAQQFIDWFGSADFQTGFVKATNNDTPLNTDALKQLPEAEKALSTITKQDIDWKVVTKQLSSWLERIQLEIL
jgi:iron(III) transport system substrate-binding protein